MVCVQKLLYNVTGVIMYEVKIERMDHFGRGIGYVNDKITFIENTLPNEIVGIEIIEEKKSFSIGKVKKYIQISKDRVEPFCPYYQVCGGCHLEHLSYEDSLLYKKDKIQNIFEKEKITIPNIQIIKNESPKNYRNKLSLKIVDGKIGFFEEKSHHLIEIEACPLAKNSINDCLKYLKSLQINNGEITIRSNYNDEILLIIKTEDKIQFDIENFKNIKLVGVILNDQTIFGNSYFFERTNGFLFKVSFNAFFQINPYITSELFKIVDHLLNSKNVVLDLYSGVGTLGLIASKKAKKVYSVEIIKNAVMDNLENKKLNKRENIYPILGETEKIIDKIKDHFDTVIIDPPRKGLDKKTREFLMNSHAKQIIYISCDPMTLIRDLKELTKKYKIEQYYLLDMFSYTYHVESICLITLDK